METTFVIFNLDVREGERDSMSELVRTYINWMILFEYKIVSNYMYTDTNHIVTVLNPRHIKMNIHRIENLENS